MPEPKPVTTLRRPALTRLPPNDTGRQWVRRVLRLVARLLVWLFARARVNGMENIPLQGPALLVGNHLGDADAILGVAASPRWIDFMAKIELYDLPIVGAIMEVYGTIWVHRGQPDRRALQAALAGLAEGRLVAIAPEGRESLTGELEEGTNGAAFLALKSGAPVVPITVTGTENGRIYGNMKRFRRTPVTLTAGPSFYLEPHPDRHTAIQMGTRAIMLALARQLPDEYRGIYRAEVDEKPAEIKEDIHDR